MLNTRVFLTSVQSSALAFAGVLCFSFSPQAIASELGKRTETTRTAPIEVTGKPVHKQSEQSVMRMAGNIERTILRLPQFSVFDEVYFTISDYVVTLKGSTTRPTLRSAAEEAVRKIEGVEDVVNQIEVLPFNRMDEDIRLRAYQAIYWHPWMERYNPNRGTASFLSPNTLVQGISLDPPIGFHPIHIIVRNGRVRLAGVVNTAGDKAMAGMLVSTLPNIFQVDNELAIAEEAKPIKPESSAKTGRKR